MSRLAFGECHYFVLLAFMRLFVQKFGVHMRVVAICWMIEGCVLVF